MAETSEPGRWEKELAQFQEVLANPKGQAIVIVGPEGSGKSVLLTILVAHAKNVTELECDGSIHRVGPRDHPNDVLGAIGKGTGGPLTYLNAKSIRERLSSSVEEFGDIHRRVVGVDAKPTQPAALKKSWLEIIPQLPEKVKFIFTQRPDGILATNKQFMGMSNVVRIDVAPPQSSDDTHPVTECHKEFMFFLQAEKGFPSGSFMGEGSRQDSGEYFSEIVLEDPKTEQKLGVIETNFTKEGELYVREKAELTEKMTRLGVPLYVLTEEALSSGDVFGIMRLTEKGDLEQIALEDFPAYEDLRRKMETKTEASGGEGSDDDSANVFRNNLVAFLINEKEFPRESLNHGIVAEAPDMDLAVAHPDTDDSLAVFDCKSGHYGKPSPEVSESMAKTYKSGLIGIQNPFAYIVHPSEESNEDFVIFEVEDEGTSYEISYGDFPTYNQLVFASPLSNKGRRICSALTVLAKDRHVFSIRTPCQDWINLQIKENKRTAAQIHRLSDSDQNIALVLAGYQKDFPKAKLPNYMFEGEVKQLSGYTSKSSGEKNWLEGNLGHKQLKYEAGVYILRPGALVLGEIQNEVGDLLELAKKNAEGDREQEEAKVSKYGKGHIATIQMDRLSEVDLLGRDKLVLAFAGMFVHTDEVEGFTVALLGDWGEGKSTIMKLLRNRLKEEHNKKFKFATFNAWEYEHTENIAAGLAQEIVNNLTKYDGFWGPFRRFWLKLKFATGLHGLGIWVCSILVISLLLSFLIVSTQPPWLIEKIMLVVKAFITSKITWLVLAVSCVLLLPNKLITGFKKVLHPVAIQVWSYLQLPSYLKHLGLAAVLKDDIKKLCKFRLGRKKRLVLFVDDLDRCQTDCIARALDAIRLVMSIPNVIVMIGIDYRIAFKAMENYYEKLGDEERDTSQIARDYLGKMIQLPVRLMPSSPKEVRKYVEQRLFPDAQIMEDIKKDVDTDTEGSVIEPSKPKKEIIEPERKGIGDRAPDVQKIEEPKSVEEMLKDTTIERDMFSDLAQRFNFTNPRQLLRLRNSYRFLKVMDSDEKYDREILMKNLFWQEFLNNWTSIIRYQCENSVTEQASLEKIEKPEAKQIVQDVREDILKIIEMPMYEEIERFVRIVVLPHSESGIRTKGELRGELKVSGELKGDGTFLGSVS